MKEITKHGVFERTLKEFECPTCGCVFHSDEYSLYFLKTDDGKIKAIEYEDCCPMCYQIVSLRENFEG